MVDPIIQRMKAEQAYGPIQSASYGDAAKSARANEIGRRLGLDPGILEHVAPDALAEDKIQRRMEEVHQNPAYAQMMANQRLAKAGIDDDHLPKVAQHTGDLVTMHNPEWMSPAFIGMAATRAVGGIFSGMSGFAHYLRGIGESAQQTRRNSGAISSYVPDPFEILAPVGQALAYTPDWLSQQLRPTTGQHYKDVVLSGSESVGGSLSALAISLATGSPMAGAVALGASTGGQSYQTGRQAGLDPNTALNYGTSDAIVETATELLPERFLFGAVKEGKGVFKTLLGDAVREVPGELVATTLQDFNQWAYVDRHKGKTFKDYLDQLPADLRDTAIATLATVGAMGSGGYVTGRYIDNKLDSARATQVDKIMAASANSETRKNNPTDFREALNQLVGGSDAANLFVPVETIDKALGDTPVEDHPFWSQYGPQIAEARQLGSDVRVPLDHAATELATEWDKYRDDVRTRPGGASINEAKKKVDPEELQRLAEEGGRIIQDTIRNSQLMRARQIVGNWAEQGGAQGTGASVTNRLVAHGLAAAYEREVTRSMDLGQQPPTMEDFAAGWMPHVIHMKQAQYEQGAGQQALEQISSPERGPLVGMPRNIAVGNERVEFGPFKRARQAAANYARKAGIAYNPPRTYARVDEARAARIAAEFEAMPHNPNDPEVQAAYEALKEETLAQWRAIKKTGLKVEFIRGKDPYGNPRNAILDVTRNNHLWVFPTEAGFGSSDADVSDNPLLEKVKGEKIDGREVTYNDVFRIVHDYFGHIKEGVGFRADGEENAWRIHSAMYSPLARRALTTETRGQNSWVNYGPHGEANRTASSEDTIFADQKIGLLPEWVSEEGLGDVSIYDQEVEALFDGRPPSLLTTPPVDADGNITLQHFSPVDGLTQTDPGMWGSRGTHFFSRSERQYMSSAPARTYFGIATGEPGGYQLEFSGRNEYEAKIQADRLYDVASDKDGLWVRGQAAVGEHAIRDAGYAGYWHNNPQIGLVAVVFEPLGVTPVERSDEQTFNQLVHIPGFSHVEPYLTPEEREGLRAQSKQKILDIVKNLPDAEEMAAVAVAGRAKKGWYASSAQAIVDVFGLKDAPRFAALLAALSPQTSVEQNLFNALRTWTIWNNNGRPTDRATIVQLMGEAVSGKKGSGSILPAWINNSVTALTAEDPGKIKLSGPKVDSFMNNLVGVTDEVTNDTWMANYAEVDQVMFRRDNKGGKGIGYKAFNIAVRRAAEIATQKTGEDWTPAEIQEAVWSFARTLYLRRDVVGETRDMQTLLDIGEVTHEDIAATPDFAVLFQDGFFRTILSEGGYDVTAVQSSGRAVGLDERASVAEPEGTGFAADAFKRFLGTAAERLERVRQRRRADRQDNEAQPELVFNQAVSPQEEVFYSAAQRAVANAPQEKASAQQWKALLTPGKTPGIKSEEIEWTGIHDWLDMQKGPIEKGALLQVLRDRGIKVEEVVLGRTDEEKLADYGLTTEDLEGDNEDAPMIVEEGNPQFQSWSSDPNNPTYRELLITLPLGQGANPDRAPSTHWDTEGVVAHVRFMEKTDAEGKRVLFIEEVQSDWHQKGRDQGYAQVPSDEERSAALQELRDAGDDRIAAWAAIEETATDLDLMQNFDLSKLNQKERRQRSQLALAEALQKSQLHENVLERIRNDLDAMKRAELRFTEANQKESAYRTGIPEAPFKSSWPALVMKRMIRWAADNGYDKIAWTTGEEQAQRYNLSQAVGRIEVIKHPDKDGLYLVDVATPQAVNAIVSNGLAERTGHTPYQMGMTAEQLKEAFGGEIASKAIEGASNPNGVALDGSALNVGGEGMKAFYDRNLVNITNDIIKKYGAKVGVVALPIKLTDQTESEDLEALLGGSAKDHPGFEITPQLREAASGGFPLFQQKRGNISITPGTNGLMQSALIRTFEDSNFSTLVHELGHFFLEDLRRRALSTGATDQERADWETFKAWSQDLGHDVQDDTPIPVDAHEYFARGFERFTWEGSAPSIGLRRLFFRLREFMLNLYKSATQFDAPITPEIREVMGRMLASDQDINEQRDRLNLISGELDKLMSEDERKAYNDLAEESRQDARDELFTRVLSTLRQERTAEARDRKAQIRSEVQADVDRQPIFRALKLLRVGLPQPDGSFSKVKLDRDQLIAAYGPGIESQLPTANRIVSDKNTLDIDQIAALSGYESGDAMVRELQQHEAQRQQQQDGGDRRSVRAKMVDDQTDQRFRDEVGDPLQNLEEEAQAAIANDRQADLLAMEMRAMGRKAGRKATSWKMAKEFAAKRVRMSTSQEAITGRKMQEYARNVSKAGQQAEDALAKGDIPEAFAAKQRQMLNMALLSEAKKVKQEVETAKARLTRISSRETIPSVDQDYLEQAHQLLEDVSLKENPTQAAKRQAFEDWYLEQVAAGIEPTVPPRYRTQLGKTHWSKLSIDEFLELDRAVGQIVELGRLKKRLREGQKERDFDEAVAEMEAQAEQQKERSKSKTTDAQRTLGGRIKSRLRGIDAAMIKMEQMVEWLDGEGVKNGPWRRLLFNIMSDAQVREKDLTEKYVGKLNALIKALPKDQVKSLDRLVDTPELVIRNSGHSQAGMAFRGTKDQILVMALNWGNDGNRQRLLDGFGWQEQEVQAVFDRLMTKQDWDFVQGVWDMVNELWPEIEQLERRVNGIAPEKVENVEVQTPHGVYHGGYFPVVFDPNESTRAELDEASKLSPSGAWHQVTTRAGSTHSRVDRVMRRPLLLNMGVITRHIGEVIHDVTHREAVAQVRKILADNRIRTVVNSRLGPEYHRRMGSWLENIATPNMANSKSDPAAIAIARHLNKGVSLVGLGFRITTILVQPVGLANSISEIGTARVLQGLRAFVAHPRQTYNEIVERSGEMRSRFNTMDASIEDMMNEAKAGKLSTIGPKAFVKYAFHGILYADMLVTSSSWIGAYNKALAEGESEEVAVSYADSVIRKTQGAGGQKDRSSIMYENQFARVFWSFFSYLNALYNQQRDVFHRGARVTSTKEALEVARRGWWVFIVPTLLQSLMFGDGPPDDENDPEGWANWLVKSIMLGNMASIPGVGALATAIGSGYGYRSNAWQSIGEDLKKSWEDLDKVAEDDDDLKGSTVQKVISTAGILTARPLGQAAATTRGIYDYERGQADPQSAQDWYQLLTKGRISQNPSAIQQLAHVGQGSQ